MLDTMKKLDETGQRILFIAPEGKLKAVVTDGDIRKCILRGGALSAPLTQAANYHPHSLPVAERGRARAELQRLGIDALPILDKHGVITDIVFAGGVDVDNRKKVDIPVVMMAGGLGTRLYPYTKILPKPLIPVGEQPIAELIMDRFRDFGCHNFTMIVNYKKGMIKSYFNELEKNYTVDFADEEVFMGTGGGLCLLKGRMDSPFFFTNCDTLLDLDYGDLYQYHKAHGNLVTMVCAFKHYVVPYGVVELGEDGGIAAMREKPELNFLTNTGVIMLICLVATVVYFYFCFRRILRESESQRPTDITYPDAASAITDRRAFIACGAVFLLVVVLLVTHAQTELTVATIGCIAAVLMALATLCTSGGHAAAGLFAKVDYRTLLFFIGLFVVVSGLEDTGCLDVLAGWISRISGGHTAVMVAIILWLSAVCSAFVDNIPFAATMVPVIQSMSQSQGVDLSVLAWALSIGTDLGGSATPIGASANVVGTSVAAKNGHPVTWGTYCKYCAPATVLVITIAMVCLFVRYL